MKDRISGIAPVQNVVDLARLIGSWWSWHAEILPKRDNKVKQRVLTPLIRSARPKKSTLQVEALNVRAHLKKQV